jgi:hypothetical protein
MTASVPAARRDHTITILKRFRKASHTTGRELESLTGSLRFISLVITQGRPFLGRLIRLAHAHPSRDARISMTAAARSDIKWWIAYLPSWSGRSLLRDHGWTTCGPDFDLETDACKNAGGVFFRGRWFIHRWSSHILALANPPGSRATDIVFLELRAIVDAAATFGIEWTRKRVVIRSDSQAAIAAVARLYSPKQSILRLIRILTHLMLIHNFDLKLEFIEGVKNTRADQISRDKLSLFLKENPDADRLQTTRLPLPRLPF